MKQTFIKNFNSYDRWNMRRLTQKNTTLCAVFFLTRRELRCTASQAELHHVVDRLWKQAGVHREPLFVCARRRRRAQWQHCFSALVQRDE